MADGLADFFTHQIIQQTHYMYISIVQVHILHTMPIIKKCNRPKLL